MIYPHRPLVMKKQLFENEDNLFGCIFEKSSVPHLEWAKKAMSRVFFCSSIHEPDRDLHHGDPARDQSSPNGSKKRSLFAKPRHRRGPNIIRCRSIDGPYALHRRVRRRQLPARRDVPKDGDDRPHIVLGLHLCGTVVRAGRIAAVRVEALVVENSLVDGYSRTVRI